MKWRVESLSADQRAGQQLMVGFDGTALSDTLKYYIGDIGVGGLILFARNLEGPAQIESLCSDCQAWAARCGQPPLLIGIDQEGGTVARLKPPFTQFPGRPPIQNETEAVEFGRITAGELKRIGINMNMAPVMDVLPADGDSFMAERAFGSDPDYVSRIGALVIDHLQKNGVMAVAKHFPGIGRTRLDSHFDRPDLKTSYEEMGRADLPPFQTAIDHRVAGIMLSHIRYLGLDDHWPASLSPRIAARLLRRQMGYTGLVLTDDLEMGAVAKHYDVETMVDQCTRAEVDLLLICRQGPKIERAAAHLGRQIDSGATAAERSDRSLSRILTAKETYLSAG